MGLQQATLAVVLFAAATFILWIPKVVASHPPEIIKRPAPQGVKVGGVATFFCSARGDPQPTINWRKNGKKVSGTQSRYTVIETNGLSLLRIEPVRAGRDDAPYECIAENGVGDAVSAEATLTVYEADKTPSGFPVIEIHSNSRVIEIGHTAVLQCRASGSPNPKVYWLKDMKRVELTSRYTLLDGSLQISQSEEADQGKYECVAENSIGTEHSKPINLYVKIRRVPPQFSRPPDPVNEVLLGGSLNLTCVAVGSPMPFVKWRRGLDEDITPENELPKAYSETSGIITMFYVVRGLSPYTEYEFHVIGVNNIGRGPPSAPVSTTTGETEMESAPRNIEVRPLSSSTMVVTWQPPETPNGQINGYKVYYTTNPHQPEASWNSQMVDNSELTTISELTPLAIYTIRVQAFTSMGAGPMSNPVQVKTQQGVPSQPSNFRAIDIGETAVTLQWSKPSHSGENIVHYELYWNDTYANEQHHQRIPNVETYTMSGLYPDTLYYIWLAARSQRGEGATSPSIPVRTKQYVPGEPTNVRVSAVNSTTIYVSWKPPAEKDRNGIIRGYHIHIHEVKDEGKSFLNEPMKYEILDGVMDYNISGLQPDTRYSVQVAALTRKGDGDRSNALTVKTPGGVPIRPVVNLKILERDPLVSIELEWERPAQTYGELRGYRVRWGVKDHHKLHEEILGSHINVKRIKDLERGIEYEFRIAGTNHIGIGQEAVKYYTTPEGTPSGPPVNISHRFQTPDVLSITWDPPIREHRNGQILRYDIQFHKKIDHGLGTERNTTIRKAVFANLDQNTEYVVRIRAYTKQGAGPFSEKIIIETERDMGRAPMQVQAIATSEQTVEVWWEPVPSRGKLIGYKIFYTMTAVEDLDEWQTKTVGLTESADLVNLEKFAQYAIAIAARFKTGLGRLSDKITVKIKPEDVPLNLRAHDVSTHSMTISYSPPIRLNPLHYKVSFDAIKVFVDAQGITQTQSIPKREITIPQQKMSLTINELSPFTTYYVNVSAVPADFSYRPPTKISITTQMAAPQPMVKPDFYGVVNGEEIQVILPQASEEYGPISHYYLVVVPEDKSNLHKNPDQFLTEEMLPSRLNRHDMSNAPYIAAKFLQRNIPYTFPLGSGDTYHNFTNRKLERGKRYRIFVRAVVDTPQKHLYTSSPFSDFLALDMREVPPGDPPHRPDPNSANSENDVSVNISTSEQGLLWVIPIIAAFILCFFLIIVYVVKKRSQPCKNPDTAVTRPLMAADLGAGPAPTDPVDMRRLNFQTPGMIHHPPIPISELANHIERLKANGNNKFSQEYESIEPGQQFSWEHSNLEVNKPKNRYANVTAYDHSRVILATLDGQVGSDYINANYCDGYRKHNAYIATQGPLQNTCADFWRMVWEQESSTIVMMTRLEERMRKKCDQYWPTRGTETYGLMTVTITATQELATYSIRTFQLTKSGSSESREIKQLQFTAWPDHGVPDNPAPFLQFLRRTKSLTPTESGPIIVHCSAGVGRTGCYIVIDSMLERMHTEKMVDIYGHVTCLRAQRNYMVQTEEQYIYIHDALNEAVICGNTEVAATELHTHIQKLMQMEPSENITSMEMEFKKLSNVKVDSSKFVTANLPCNKDKNRLVHILPFESTRVCLSVDRGIEGSDYINASFIDGYRYRMAYIAAQGPLPETAEDFWRMLWEHNSTIVVMLTKLKEMGKEKCTQYWPDTRSVRYQYYVVDPVAEYNMPQYKLREFKVTDARDGSSRTVRQFQFMDWPEQGVPKSGEGFIDFIGQVHKTKEQFGQDGPITIHCSAGVGRTGVFITLSIVLERMQYEGVLDVFQTVRILRSQRIHMVQTEDQYQFCYRAALEYLGSFDHYTN
ncbi:CLUMA_CG013255, isoform B [Clunio marinus]|uniref:protein-tyrosine-phosphatase n=1 Tax=Clunio marinus TaxID=568069 RepID=A0A1J1II68_9DIPT|nr:CLUMA_CG013255, isoform B [Clunio marinus]